ncbi:MAG TPA: ABC transporter substrate-binding protein [Candidatus Kapabacteria bacterium]|jgi:iron complex transport system substrate-binding protein
MKQFRISKARVWLALSISAIILSSCGKSNAPPATLAEQMKADTGIRIVCVSKQLTEMIFALGMGDKVVGTDLTSNYPPEQTAKLPKVGYHRLLSAEGIISLHPTIVIHDSNNAPKAVLDQVRSAGIPVEYFPEAQNIDQAKQVMRDLGKSFGVEHRADSLCHYLDSTMALARSIKHETHPKVVIIHFGMVGMSYLVITKKNLASKMIEWAGGINPIDPGRGMAQLSPELIAEAQPDIILVTDYGFDHAGGIEGVKKLPGVGLTPAAQNNRIYRIAEHDIVYFGPRTGDNVMEFEKLLYPNENPSR